METSLPPVSSAIQRAARITAPGPGEARRRDGVRLGDWAVHLPGVVRLGVDRGAVDAGGVDMLVPGEVRDGDAVLRSCCGRRGLGGPGGGVRDADRESSERRERRERRQIRRLRGELWVEAMKSATTSAGTVPGEMDLEVRRLA